MLKIITKLLVGFVALMILLVGVLAVALPRIINTEEFRAALHEGAAEALGTPVEWSSLKAGLVPLRLIIEEPVLLADVTKREDARLTAASIAALMQRRGYRVKLQQLDPYLNVDPGTMSPYQHGEVYVTVDGAETWQPSLQLPPGYIKGAAGAGDAFCAGMLLGIHEGWPVARSLQLAVCSAAMSLSEPGCTEACTTLADTLALAETYPFQPAII